MSLRTGTGSDNHQPISIHQKTGLCRDSITKTEQFIGLRNALRLRGTGWYELNTSMRVHENSRWAVTQMGEKYL
jgi:hypothetical protein